MPKQSQTTTSRKLLNSLGYGLGGFLLTWVVYILTIQVLSWLGMESSSSAEEIIDEIVSMGRSLMFVNWIIISVQFGVFAFVGSLLIQLKKS